MENEPMVTTRVSLPYYSLGPAPFPVSIDHLDFQLFGDAHINKGSLRLTDAAQSQRGAIWSKSPLQSNNWQVDLRFQVGGSPNLEHFGDGFAFWVVQERGVVGEALGGLGVFFDTFKNDNFRSKKHPWVYGSFQPKAGKYSELKETQGVNGCHAPFRDANPDVLATTVARITLLNGILSVVMRPKGSIDWIQCFEIPNVQFPTPTSGKEYFIGVTAMTGGLIDNHHFLQLQMYGNVDIQPFAYSHAYKITQMPDMWHAMKESGKIAREFADWEESDSFSDELKWTVGNKAKPHMNDDYDEQYQEQELEEGEEEDEEPYRVYTDEAEFDEGNGEEEEEEEEGLRRTAQEEEIVLTPEAKAIMQRPAIHGKLQATHVLNQEMMQNLHHQIQTRMQSVTDQMHRAAREIRTKEHALSLRILGLGQKLKVTVTDPFEENVQQMQSGWFWPFCIFVCLIVGTGVFGHTRYKKFMKQHVL
ncbi:hypothetical protein BASA81_002228 [Batrachochytrium salamandrivorans]|nr:hypothetical protein BASA81_002228 [Batrachochytrium salamandrivorans]